MKESCKLGYLGNPFVRLFIALCPVVAGAVTGIAGLTLGVTLFAVLLCSGLVMALTDKICPEGARIPVGALVICLFVSLATMLLNALNPMLAEELGVYLPLCAVGAMLALLLPGCEGSIACRGGKSAVASLIMLVVIGALRELVSSGSCFGATLWNVDAANALISIFPAGGFIMLGILTGIAAAIRGSGKESAK